jgi:hypothetical protein
MLLVAVEKTSDHTADTFGLRTTELHYPGTHLLTTEKQKLLLQQTGVR